MKISDLNDKLVSSLYLERFQDLQDIFKFCTNVKRHEAISRIQKTVNWITKI